MIFTVYSKTFSFLYRGNLNIFPIQPLIYEFTSLHLSSILPKISHLFGFQVTLAFLLDRKPNEDILHCEMKH